MNDTTKVGEVSAICGFIFAIERGENKYLFPRYVNDGYYWMILWLGKRFIFTTFARMGRLDREP